MQKRDELIVKIFYYTGIRSQELVKIKKEDIVNDILKIKDKDILLDKNLLASINDYMNLTKVKDNEYLFFANSRNNFSSTANDFNKHKDITSRSIENIFNKYKNIIDENLSINDLRNSYIYNLKNQLLNIKIDKIYSHEVIKSNSDYISLNSS